MPVGKDETVAVEPLRVFGVVLEELGEKNVGDGGHSLQVSYYLEVATHHGSTGVTRVGLLVSEKSVEKPPESFVGWVRRSR